LAKNIPTFLHLSSQERRIFLLKIDLNMLLDEICRLKALYIELEGVLRPEIGVKKKSEEKTLLIIS